LKNQATHLDAFSLLCGEKIGEGSSRMVFECRLRRDLVVKVEKECNWRAFDNVKELTNWEDAKNRPALKKWLAPIEFASPDCRILLMHRAEPLPISYKLPDKMPAFLNDLKPENFGLIDGNLVCVDYAIIRLQLSARLRAVKWWMPQ